MSFVLRAPNFLDEQHYLGRGRSMLIYEDEFGLISFMNPTSRRLPQHRWLELNRWCLIGEKNGGSRQWSRAVRWLKKRRPEVTTVVSYSDPAVGHTGALYRACNWLWAPTWHRLRPPPTGNGSWANKGVSVKDRWVFLLKPDSERVALLRLSDPGLLKRFPWAEYRAGTLG